MLYGYDALNRISNIHYGNGVETAYTYDGNGNHTAKTGTQATLGDIISGSNALDLSYAYDVRGQLLEERRNGASVCCAYDKAGNRRRMHREKSVIFIMRRPSWSKRKALPIENSFLMTVRAV